jgi:hypothetical protein
MNAALEKSQRRMKPVGDAVIARKNQLAYFFSPRRKFVVSAVLLQNFEAIQLRQRSFWNCIT